MPLRDLYESIVLNVCVIKSWLVVVACECVSGTFFYCWGFLAYNNFYFLPSRMNCVFLLALMKRVQVQ